MRPHPSPMMMGGRGGPFTLAASPATLSASGFNGGTEVTASTTVTPAGQAGFTYTYAWALLSGSGSISATSPGSATTTFSGVAPDNSTISATFRCTATRNDGRTATADVAVSLSAAAPGMTAWADSGSTGAKSTPGGAPYTEVPTATINNGFPAYSYVWTVGGTGASITGATTATPTVTVAAQASGSHTSVTIGLAVTDSHGQHASGSQTWNLTWT